MIKYEQPLCTGTQIHILKSLYFDKFLFNA